MTDDVTLGHSIRLGSCCVCGGNPERVHTVVMLDHKAPIAGTGWGCVVCGLKADGAFAVVCDDCIGKPVRLVCSGFPQEDKRVALVEVIDTRFAHDERRHKEDPYG